MSEHELLEQDILAIDLGNGTTSFKAGTGEQGSFSSLVRPFRDTSGLGLNRDVFVTKDGSSYLVGDACRDELMPTRSTDSSFYSSTEMRILFLKVLHDAGIKSPIIVTGLPTEFHQSECREFEENLRRWAKGEGYNVRLIKVVPQWAAPWFDDELEDEEGNRIPLDAVLKGRWGIIDIGQGTTDLGQFINGRVSEARHGESKGVSNIHKAIFTTLKTQPEALNQDAKKNLVIPKGFSLDLQASEYTIDLWLREGHIPWRGTKLDMAAISLPARREFAKDLLPRGIAKVWGSTDFLTGMILSGGGTSVLGREVFKEYITCPMYSANDPSLSTVRGYFRFAKTQMLKAIKQ